MRLGDIEQGSPTSTVLQASEASHSPSSRQKAALQELMKEPRRQSLTTSGTRPAGAQPRPAQEEEGAAAEATQEGEQQGHTSHSQPVHGAPDEAGGQRQGVLQGERQAGCAAEAQPEQEHLQPPAMQRGSLQQQTGGSEPEQAAPRPSAFSRAGESSTGPAAVRPPGQVAGADSATSFAAAAAPEAAGSSRQGSDQSVPQSRCPSPLCQSTLHLECWSALHLCPSHKVSTMTQAVIGTMSGPMKTQHARQLLLL